MWCITLVPHTLPCDWPQLHLSNQHCFWVVRSCMITKICEWIGPTSYANCLARAYDGKVALSLYTVNTKLKHHTWLEDSDFGEVLKPKVYLLCAGVKNLQVSLMNRMSFLHRRVTLSKWPFSRLFFLTLAYLLYSWCCLLKLIKIYNIYIKLWIKPCVKKKKKKKKEKKRKENTDKTLFYLSDRSRLVIW